jgi:hypothetical protein
VAYVSLALAKEHCNITAEVSDTLLQMYVDAAEQRVAAYLNRPLSDVLDPIEPPDVADPVGFATAVKHAILLYVADAVDNRGTLVIGTISSTLPTAENILYPYRVGLGV